MFTAIRGRDPKQATPLQEGVVVGVVFFVVYVLTRTRDLGGDDKVFALAFESWHHGSAGVCVKRGMRSEIRQEPFDYAQGRLWETLPSPS